MSGRVISAVLRFQPARRGGGLLVDAPGQRSCASLRLCAEGLGVASRQSDEVMLEWEWNRPIGATGDAPPHHWAIEYWSLNGPAGVALHVDGDAQKLCSGVLRSTCNAWRRVWASLNGVAAGSHIPITTTVAQCSQGVATIRALAEVLTARSDLRARLRDSERVARLAVELADGIIGAARPPEPILRDPTDIVFALRACGFQYRFGRPLSLSERQDDLSEVVARTRHRLTQNPYRRDAGLPPDEEITQWVRRAYYDIEPWPLSALVDD